MRYLRGSIVLLVLVLVPVLVSCRSNEPTVAAVAVSPTSLEVGHGRYQPLRIDWTPSETLEGDSELLWVFVHLIDADKAVLRTFDHRLPKPWRVGETISYSLPIGQSALAPSLPAGSYGLTLGLYDGGQRRWPLAVDGETRGRDEYEVARVRVPEGNDEAPRFLYSESWKEVEPGENAQTLARRWMVDPGSIEVEGLPESASNLRIVLRVPRIGGPLRLALDEGAEEATVHLRTDCDGFKATLTGPGLHEVVVPVSWQRCRLEFETNFHVVELNSLQQVVLALEQLSWN